MVMKHPPGQDEPQNNALGNPYDPIINGNILMKGAGFGLLGNMVVGIIGAFVAGFVLPIIGISIGGGILGSILHATIGTIILLFVISLVKKGR